MAAFTDGFAYADGSYLPDQTGWAYIGPSLPATLPLGYVINSGQLTVGWTGGYASSVLHDTGSPEHYAEATFVHAASGVSTALDIRAADGSNGIYLYTFADALRLSAVVNGTETVIHTGASGSYIPGSLYRVTASATSYTVSRNAVAIAEFTALSFSDPAIDSNRRTGFSGLLGNANALFDNFATDFTGVGAISIDTEPKPNQVFQYNKSGPAQRTLAFSGGYVGDVDALEFCVEGFVSGAALAGFDWQDLPAGSTFADGAWSIIITIPAGPWVRLRLRAKNHPTDLTAATQNRWGVGALVVFDGQSNIQNWAGSGFTTADELVSKYDPETGNWVKTSLGTAENIFAATLAASLGCVVGFANVAVGSTTIEPHVIAGYWTALINVIDAMGGDIGFYVWKQGESDTGGSGVGGDVAAYVSYFTTLATNLRSHCGRTAAQLPIIVCPIGRNMGVTADDQDWTNIREAHHRLANVYPGVTGVPSCYIGGDAIALPHGVGNTLHEDLAGNSESAARAVQSLLKALGKVANDGQGPIPTTAVQFGSYIWVSFNLNGASALAQTAAGDLVGWVVRDSTGTVVTGTAATLVGDQVRIALPGSPPAGPYTVAHLEGEDPLGGAVDATTVALVRGNVQLRGGGLYTEAVATRKRLPVSTGVTLTSTDVAGSTALDGSSIVTMVQLSTVDVAVPVSIDGEAIAPRVYLQTPDIAAVTTLDGSAISTVIPLSTTSVAASTSIGGSAIGVDGSISYVVGTQRRLRIPAEDRYLLGSHDAPALPTFFKDPDALLDYTVDWAARGWLEDGEEITSSEWTVADGLTEAHRDLSDGAMTIWLSGGSIGTTYDLTAAITTNQGRIDERTLQIIVTER